MGSKKIKILIFVTSLIFSITPKVQAFESSSASFEVHAGDIESTAGSSSSTNFKNQDAGGQVGNGFSSSVLEDYSGILYWLYGSFGQNYTQAHYRWRNDDGNESTATWAAAEDTTLTNVSINSTQRLRFLVSNEGWTRGSGQQLQIEFAELSSGSDCAGGPFATSYTAVPTGSSLHWKMTSSGNVSDATATTNNAGLTDESAFFVTSQVKSAGNTTASVTITSENFTEAEFVISPTANATSGATYCFRLTNNGSSANYTYSQYAKATLSTGLPATGELTSVTFDTTGSASYSATYNSFLWSGSLGTGKVRFQLATSNCSNGSTNPPTCNTGAWSYVGGSLCNSSDWYDAGVSGSATEITCAPLNHNNQRYFKYKVQLCSATDCTSSGSTSPTINDINVIWAP